MKTHMNQIADSGFQVALNITYWELGITLNNQKSGNITRIMLDYGFSRCISMPDASRQGHPGIMHSPTKTRLGQCPNVSHHPTISDVISNRYLKVMFKIPKKGHFPTQNKTVALQISSANSSLNFFASFEVPGFGFLSRLITVAA